MPFAPLVTTRVPSCLAVRGAIRAVHEMQLLKRLEQQPLETQKQVVSQLTSVIGSVKHISEGEGEGATSA